VREGEHALAGRQRAEHLGLLLLAPRCRDDAAGQHDRRQERLGRDHPSELLSDDPDLDGAGAHAAVLLGERQTEHAHLGEAGPQQLVEAGVLGDGAAAVLEVGVRLAHEPADRLAQRLLLLVIGEVHATASFRVRGSSWR
jgi:hypothetical protein